MSDDKDTPLEPLGPDFSVTVVVDFAQVRIERGMPPIKAKVCEHKSLLYSQSERRVWCRDCERTVDGFDAFKTVVGQWEEMARDLHRKQVAVNDALNQTARLRATKALDKVWSGNVMAVACPHCKGGLLPEDFVSGARSAWARELELAHRARPAPTGEIGGDNG